MASNKILNDTPLSPLSCRLERHLLGSVRPEVTSGDEARSVGCSHLNYDPCTEGKVTSWSQGVQPELVRMLMRCEVGQQIGTTVEVSRKVSVKLFAYTTQSDVISGVE